MNCRGHDARTLATDPQSGKVQTSFTKAYQIMNQAP